MALIQSWNDCNLDWDNPDPYNKLYYIALLTALEERINVTTIIPVGTGTNFPLRVHQARNHLSAMKDGEITMVCPFLHNIAEVIIILARSFFKTLGEQGVEPIKQEGLQLPFTFCDSYTIKECLKSYRKAIDRLHLTTSKHSVICVDVTASSSFVSPYDVLSPEQYPDSVEGFYTDTVINSVFDYAKRETTELYQERLKYWQDFLLIEENNSFSNFSGGVSSALYTISPTNDYYTISAKDCCILFGVHKRCKYSAKLHIYFDVDDEYPSLPKLTTYDYELGYGLKLHKDFIGVTNPGCSQVIEYKATNDFKLIKPAITDTERAARGTVFNGRWWGVADFYCEGGFKFRPDDK